jgi:ribonuclease HII
MTPVNSRRFQFSDIPHEWLPDDVTSASFRIVGCDENGYGAIAGPLLTTGVVIPAGIELHPDLRDSKALPPRSARILSVARWVYDNCEVFFEEVGSAEIDRVGVYEANRRSYSRIIERARADLAIVDGIMKIDTQHHYVSTPKGERFAPVAAASIAGKVYRDTIMLALDGLFPDYRFDNAAYGKAAIDALIAHGRHSPIHRRSYNIRALPPEMANTPHYRIGGS